MYSSVLNILCVSASTAISKPASMSFLAVVGVKAARLSNGLVSHLSQSGVFDVIVAIGYRLILGSKYLRGDTSG